MGDDLKNLLCRNASARSIDFHITHIHSQCRRRWPLYTVTRESAVSVPSPFPFTYLQPRPIVGTPFTIASHERRIEKLSKGVRARENKRGSKWSMVGQTDTDHKSTTEVLFSHFPEAPRRRSLEIIKRGGRAGQIEGLWDLVYMLQRGKRGL